MKIVTIVGAESTGTTTLAKALATRYHTIWIPEYGRFYSIEKMKKNSGWTAKDFVKIATEQNRLEEMFIEQASKLLICDTDSFATCLWQERYMGSISSEVAKIAKRRSCDLYIVTGDEIPFVQDGTRDGEYIRHDMQKRFLGELAKQHVPYIIVTGSVNQRVACACKTINSVIID